MVSQAAQSESLLTVDIISGVPVICPGARNADLLGKLMNSDLFSILITIPLG